MILESPSELSREELIALVAALMAENAALKARIAELERRLGLNSQNSGKPPSSDGLKKPARVRSLREKSSKKSGGQEGHEGETLRQSAEPDHIANHYPAGCAECGAALTPDMAKDHAARQVFDLPQPQPLVVTEHRAHICRCGACGATTRAAFPDGVNAPVQYGARLGAFVIYLLHYQLLPEARLVELMADLFGVKLAAATIARMSGACAKGLKGFGETVQGLVAGAKVKHMDETGFRIGGKTQWLHVACTALLTFYRVCAKRGSLLANVVGIVVHDHWKPYYTMQGVLHALCNAHHLRELKALVEIEKEDWARKMQRLLRRACHAANLARERGVPLKPRLIECFERSYDAILAEGLAFHEAQPPLTAKGGGKCRGRAPRRTGHNLLSRLLTRKEDTLRFLHDPSAPFTNNQAERDGRMMKLRQKISGGFRSLEGASDFALIRSFLSTAKKQGWKIIEALTGDPANLAKSLRLA
ncbi:MAG TPA: IS66 family transposase [Candidatus Dormibacteraeota bacterium]|nr:IS66 family transposase [Candidatus Dormibacteraeota bacterium]